MDAEKLKGMAIVSVSEGSRLGRVADLLIESATLKVAAVRIENGGQSYVIPYELLKNVGADAITVEGSRVTQAEGGAFSGLVGIGDFKKLKVVDEAGTLLGAVATLNIDTTSGQIVDMVAHRGGMLGLGGTNTTIVAERVRGIGPEVVTVAAEAAPLAG